jgi:3-dehydroquinate synthase
VSAELVFSIGGTQTEVAFAGALDLSREAAPGGTLTVFDTTTHALFGAGAVHPLVIPAGERAKTLQSAEQILLGCTRAGLGRDGAVVGVGGGVVCDLAAFAASLYMRGCRLSLVPTTLLAMVDASLGGKTGVDFAGHKNIVGTFYPAARITVVTALLARLPEREYLSGLAEAIKTAMIGDGDLLSILERRRGDVMARDPALLAEVVRRCLAVKGGIVSEDPRETGRRAVLNLGHTFGHALESVSGFSGWTHGEAVAWGIGRALRAGTLTGETDAAYEGRVRGILTSYGYRLEADADPASLLLAMGMDKKRLGGRFRLVVARAPQEVAVMEADGELILRCLGRSGGGGSG